MRKPRLFLLAGWALATASPAWCGQILTFSNEDASRDDSVTYQDSGKFRTESKLRNGQTLVTIGRKEKGFIQYLIPEKRIYAEIKPGDVQSFTKAKLIRKHPERKAVIEKMFESMGSSSGAQPPSPWKLTKAGAKSGKWACDLYSRKVSGGEERVCVMEAKVLGIDAQLYHSSETLKETLQEPPGKSSEKEYLAGLSPSLVAVEMSHLRDGKVTNDHVLKRAESAKLPLALFAVPSDYRMLDADAMLTLVEDSTRQK